MEEKNNVRFIKGLGFLISSGIGFIASLVAYIITAVNSYYDDGYGVSISYGNKDLLVLIIISLLMMLLGVIFMVNAKKNKETEEYVPTLFLLSEALVFGIYVLCSILKPAIKGSVEVNSLYIVSIIVVILSLGSATVSGLATSNILRKKKSEHHYLLLAIMCVLLTVSISLYCLLAGINSLPSSNVVGIMYFIIAIIQFVELAFQLNAIYCKR